MHSLITITKDAIQEIQYDVLFLQQTFSLQNVRII